MPLVLNQATNMRTGKPTGRDHDGRTPMQRLENDAARLERVLATLDSNGDDLGEGELTANELVLLRTVAGDQHLVNVDHIVQSYMDGDDVRVILDAGGNLLIPPGEAKQAGLAVDPRPRTPKSSDTTYKQPLDSGAVDSTNPLQTWEGNMNSALPMPEMNYSQPPRKGHAEMEYEPCVNCPEDVLPVPVMNARFVPTEPQARYASYGAHDDDAGDVLPMPVMTY